MANSEDPDEASYQDQHYLPKRAEKLSILAVRNKWFPGADPEGARGVRSNPVWLKILFSEISNLINSWCRIYPNK